LLAKNLKIYSIPELGERDIVSCFKYYLTLIPPDGAFYRRPASSQSDGTPAFTRQVVGKNTLNGLIKNFCYYHPIRAHLWRIALVSVSVFGCPKIYWRC